ncbi:MAG: transglycosylase domain-containing protein [Deltaproteobacteria bacterium]|nr:transglycosylase domain-containing protein [Deltaproteobacteria bacterium]MDQ3299323.1 transglycosylase domain-containing protein [Myxococcota bacterium]
MEALRHAWRVARSPRLRWPRRVVTAFAALGVLACVTWWVAVRAATFPAHLLDKASATSLVVVDANGVLLRQEATSAGTRERWVPLDEISPHLVNATLASEDNAFHDHAGVDWSALARAAWLNVKGGEFGGSTITMQLVRLTAGTPRSLSGKLRQMVLAARLERSLSKREILEQYFNRVYYGNGAWGAEQAARVYFDKRAVNLSIGEAALLAVMPRGPTYYDPFRHRARVMSRRSHILGLMVKHGHLTADDRALAERIALDLERTRPSFRAPHFVELIKERLPSAFQRGATIRTTLDWDLQRHVEVSLGTHLDRLGSRNVTQAALVVLRNSDGAILALVGSKDFHDSAANGAFNAVTARLRPGSTLKPFVYGAAFEIGDTPATIAEDVVLPEDAHQFYSKDVRSHGFARYRESLAGSYNLSAVHTLQRVGMKPVLHKLRTAGLATLDRPDADYDWGLAIGHAETRLLDLAAAFTTFGRAGQPVAPRAVDSATTSDGRSWIEPVVTRDRVFSEEVAYLLFDILSDPDARKPMFGDRVPLNLPFPVALKTGTTKAYTDLWAIGVTREYTVGVWAGNFDGSPTHHVMSTEGATPLVRAAYTAIAARYGDPTAPPRPATIVSGSICPLSGKRPGPHCEHHKRELFITGHIPDATCDWHQLVCGVPAVVYPPAIRSWARFYGRATPPRCEVDDTGAAVSITYPVEGARFLLEPHRPREAQRPPLAALPASPDLQWTIDGEPADRWIPTPGTHRVQVARGDRVDAVTITYE